MIEEDPNDGIVRTMAGAAHQQAMHGNNGGVPKQRCLICGSGRKAIWAVKNS